MVCFECASRLTEITLWGLVVLRVGQPIEWDAVAMKVTKTDKAEAIRRDAGL